MLLGLAACGSAFAVDTRIVDAIENLPALSNWTPAFSRILTQDLVPYRAFGVRPGARVHRARTIDFLADALGRPTSDARIAAAVDDLHPGTTIGDFLRSLHLREQLTPSDLQPFLQIGDSPAMPTTSHEQRLERLRQVMNFRRQLLSRLALAPVNQSEHVLDAIFTETLRGLPAGEVHLSAASALFPRRWDRRSRRWRNPNALHFLRTVRSEAVTLQRYVTLFYSIRATGLAGSTDVRGLLRRLTTLQQEEPGLVQGLQIGDAWNDLATAPTLGTAEQHATSEKFLTLLRFCAEKGLAVRLDAFAIADRGLLYEPLATALATYQGPPLRVFVSHTLAMSPHWCSPDQGLCANAQLKPTLEQSPFLASYLGRSHPTATEPANAPLPIAATSLGAAVLGYDSFLVVPGALPSLEVAGNTDCIRTIVDYLRDVNEPGTKPFDPPPSTPL